MSNINLFEVITATSTLDSFYKEVFCIRESKKAINDSIIHNEEKNNSVIFKNYKYAGEILERFIDHLDEISESELESLAVISSIAIFHKSFTRYGNQIELGYQNLIEASKKYPENQLLKVSLYLYDVFEKESHIDYHSKELIELFQTLETKQLDFLLQLLIAASINSLPHSHWDPMAKTLLALEKPKRILAVISNVFYTLTPETYKELSQFNRVFMFIYAGLFKKVFNLLKKDFKGYPFYELIAKNSNDVLREKITSLKTLEKSMNQQGLLNEMELSVIHLLNYKFNFLITMKNDYSRLEQITSDYNFEVNKDEFVLNLIAESGTRFARKIFEPEKIEFYLSYIQLRVYNADKFDENNLKEFHDWLVKDEEKLFNDKKLNHLAVYTLYRLHKFSDLPLFEKITEKMLEPNVLDKMYNSNSTIVSYLFERIDLVNEDLKNKFFEHITVKNGISYMVRSNDTIFLKKLNILPKEIIVDYVSVESLDTLIDNQLKLISLINKNEIVSEELQNPLYLMEYIEHYRTYDFFNFLQSIYKFIKDIVTKSNENENMIYKELFNELHEAIGYIKEQDEDLIIPSLKRFFVSSENDALEAIEQLSLNSIGYSFKNNMSKLLELRKQVSINLFSIETVQKSIFDKINDSYLESVDSYSRNDMDYLLLISNFHKELKEVDFLNKESKAKLDESYNKILMSLDVLKEKSLFEEIIAAYYKLEKTNLYI